MDPLKRYKRTLRSQDHTLKTTLLCDHWVQRDDAQGRKGEEDPEITSLQWIKGSDWVILSWQSPRRNKMAELWCSHGSSGPGILKELRELRSGLEIVWGGETNCGHISIFSVGDIRQRKQHLYGGIIREAVFSTRTSFS